MRPGAFVDVSRVKKYTEQDYLLPEEPAFSWLLTKKVLKTLYIFLIQQLH